MIPILVLLPYFVVKSYERSRRVNQIVESLAQGSRDLEQMTRLMDGPVTPWVGETKRRATPRRRKAKSCRLPDPARLTHDRLAELAGFDRRQLTMLTHSSMATDD